MDLIIGYVMDAARWLLIVVLAFLYPQDYSAWTGKVVKVIRGDEIQVDRNGTKETVRFYGIDSPIWWKTPKQASARVALESRSRRQEGLDYKKNKVPVPQNPGQAAKSYIVGRILGKTVRVQPLPGHIQGPWYKPRIRPHDRYDRIIGLVSINGVSLNRELLRKGWAWWYKPFVPFERGLKRLEDKARKARRGIWAQPDPIPPWRWQGTPVDTRDHPLQEKAARAGE